MLVLMHNSRAPKVVQLECLLPVSQQIVDGVGRACAIRRDRWIVHRVRQPNV